MRLADRPSSRSRLRRRGFPIMGFVGPNGMGKSWVMVHDTMPSLACGRPVLSTVRLLDWQDPRPCPGGEACDDPRSHHVLRRTATLVDGVVRFGAIPTGEVHRAAHPFYVRLSSFGQLLDWRDGDVLLDEVTGVASSRDHASLPAPILDLLVQLRRRNIVLRWSAPSWARADKVIREVTQSVSLCTATMTKRRPQPPDESPRLWLDRRLITVRTFDAALYEEWETSQVDSVKPDITQRLWRPGLLANQAYDTLDPVSNLGFSVLGTCISCGGRRSQSKCSCDDADSHDHGGHGAAAQPLAGTPRALPASGSLPVLDPLDPFAPAPAGLNG